MTLFPPILVWLHYRQDIPVGPSVPCVDILARILVQDVGVSFVVLNASLVTKKRDV